MATSNLIYLSVRAVLEKQNHSADILGICKVSGRTFFPSPMDKQTVSLQTLLFSIFFFSFGGHDHSVHSYESGIYADLH